MSYYAMLDDDSLGQVATTTGWGDFGRAVVAVGKDKVPEAAILAAHGWSQNLDALVENLERLAAIPVREAGRFDKGGKRVEAARIADPVAVELLAKLKKSRTPQHQVVYVTDNIDAPPHPDDLPLNVAYAKGEPPTKIDDGGESESVNLETPEGQSYAGLEAEAFEEIFQEAAAPVVYPDRELTPAEARFDYAGFEIETEEPINDAISSLDDRWSLVLDQLDSSVRSAVSGHLNELLSVQDLREVQRITLYTGAFVGEFVEHVMPVYEAGLDAGMQEAGYVDRQDHGLSRNMGRYEALVQSRGTEIARSMATAALKKVTGSFQNSLDAKITRGDALAAYSGVFGDLREAGVRETGVRTAMNDAASSGRFDVGQELAGDGFIVGIQRTEIRDARNHPLSKIVDLATIKMDDPRIRYFKGALHYYERGTFVFLNAEDVAQFDFFWTSSADLDWMIERGKTLSPDFFN